MAAVKEEAGWHLQFTICTGLVSKMGRQLVLWIQDHTRCCVLLNLPLDTFQSLRLWHYEATLVRAQKMKNLRVSEGWCFPFVSGNAERHTGCTETAQAAASLWRPWNSLSAISDTYAHHRQFRSGKGKTAKEITLNVSFLKKKKSESPEMVVCLSQSLFQDCETTPVAKRIINMSREHILKYSSITTISYNLKIMLFF